MQYDFNAPVDRRGHFAMKWDDMESRIGKADLIPLWVADMDLQCPQPVMEAVERRAKQGMYGYTHRPESYFQAVCDWQHNRYGWQADPALCSFNLGVIPAMSAIIQELTQPGDKILFLTPVYPPFNGTVVNNGRMPLKVPLMVEGTRYGVDFEAFEEALKQRPKLFLLCNPHNPVGRVWSEPELRRMGELCERYGVMVVSDEIHADLTLWGNRHIPYAALGKAFADNCIMLLSATKTFNLAGLQASTTVYPNAQLKQRMDRFWGTLDIMRNSCFSLVAVEAAYRYGEEWLQQVVAHFEGNMKYILDFLETNIPEIKTYLPDATYLMWLDFRGLGLDGDGCRDFLIHQAGLALNDGRSFGGEPGFFRLNVACPRNALEQAMGQLHNAVKLHRKG